MTSRSTALISTALIVLVGVIAWLYWRPFNPTANVAANDDLDSGQVDGGARRSMPSNDGRTRPSNRPSNTEPRDNRPIAAPANTQETNPPVEQPRGKAKLVPVVKPTLDWNLGKSDYERISKDSSASEQDRVEAASRLVLDFWKWPGRDVQKLGGFKFDQAMYRELDGFSAPTGIPDVVIVHLDGEPPNPCLERMIGLENGLSRIDLTVRVMASREWAQRYFLGWVVGGVRSTPFRGKLGSERGLYIGDVCQGDAKDSLQDGGYIYFVRHNVAIRLNFYRRKYDVDPFQLNVVALAQKIDREIQAQSHTAATWDDLDLFRPMIDEFAFSPDELVQGAGDLRVAVTCTAHHPQDKKIWFFAEPQDARRVRISPQLEAPTSARFFMENYVEGRPYKAWLVAYDEALLFSLAEASAVVAPLKPK